MSEYFYRSPGEEYGPISLESLRQQIASGQLSGKDEFRLANESTWTRVADYISQEMCDDSKTSSTMSSVPISNGEYGVTEPVTETVQEPVAIAIGLQTYGEPRVESGLNAVDGLQMFPSPENPSIVDGLPLAQGHPHHTNQLVEAVTSREIDLTPAAVMGQAPLPAAQADVNPLPLMNVESPAPVLSQKQLAPDPVVTASLWYARMGLVERGPMEFEKLIQMAGSGYILPSDKVRKIESEWMIARAVPGLFSGGPTSFQNPLRNPPPIVARPPLDALRMPVSTQVQTGIPGPASPPMPAPFSLPANEPARPSVTSVESTERPMSTQSAVETAPVSHYKPAADPDPIEVGKPSERPTRRPSELPTGESRHKIRRGHFEEPQLFTRRNLTVFASVAVVSMMLFYLLGPKSPTTDDFQPLFRELDGDYFPLAHTLEREPNMEFWIVTKKEVYHRLDSIVQKTKNKHTWLPIRGYLITAGESMMQAVKASTADEAHALLLKAHENLEHARNELDGKTSHRSNGKNK